MRHANEISKAPSSVSALHIVPPDQRIAAGKALRDKVPREWHGGWKEFKGRPSPIDILRKSDVGRMKQLVPIRYGRMLQSPFAFYRGSAGLMASDLSRTPNTGLQVQACGDCHLMNFGGFATPERNVIFDINDFDETSPAPWEWDVKRLVANFVTVGRFRNFSEDDTRKCARRAARSYRKHMAKYAQMPILEAWYSRIDVEDLLKESTAEMKQGGAREWTKKLKDKEVSSHDLAYEKLAVEAGGIPRILDQPPLIYHVSADGRSKESALIEESFRRYKDNVAPEVRTLLDRYTMVDAAIKVVGV